VGGVSAAAEVIVAQSGIAGVGGVIWVTYNAGEPVIRSDAQTATFGLTSTRITRT
jgi:hypothetical protein